MPLRSDQTFNVNGHVSQEDAVADGDSNRPSVDAQETLNDAQEDPFLLDQSEADAVSRQMGHIN